MGFDLGVVLSVLGGGMYWDGVGGTPWKKNMAMRILLFLPSVSLGHRKTVNPGPWGSEERVLKQCFVLQWCFRGAGILYSSDQIPICCMGELIQWHGIFRKMECIKTVLIQVRVANKMMSKWRDARFKWWIKHLGRTLQLKPKFLQIQTLSLESFSSDQRMPHCNLRATHSYFAVRQWRRLKPPTTLDHGRQ